MADTNSVASLMDSTTNKIQQLQQAFAELESYRAITLNLKWKELEEHFHGLERSLKRRFCELEDQEKEFETKVSESQETLKRREAAVLAKEQASLEKLQEKRDAAISAIGNVLENYKKGSPAEPALVDSEGHHGADLIVDKKPPDTKAAGGDFEDMKNHSDNGNMEVTPSSQLCKLCVDMDSEGLHKFVSDNRKNLAAIREELPFALKAATDPACLVLRSLEDFYQVPVLDGKKDASLLGLRRTCIMLLECLGMLLADPKLGSFQDIISDYVKEQAKSIAEQWKPKLDNLDVDASNGNSLEAHAFLLLIATFGIASDFDQEEMCKLVPAVCRRRQIAELCHSLGLVKKIPGVIEVLVNSGRQIDAVNLAYAFELTDQFSPVPLLKSYLKEARKASSSAKQGNTSPTSQNEVDERELTALKAVIKCVDDHKLEEQYPLDSLEKRVLQLANAKADKRAAEVARPQPKRPRANVGGYVSRVTNIADKSFYTRMSDRYPPYMYERPYVYPGHADNHGSSLLSSATYNLSPSHGNFFGNGYHYQVPAPYLH